MSKKKIQISYLLDETGSMFNVVDETISTFNEYIQEMLGTKNAKDTRFTFMKFDSNHQTTVHKGVKLGAVKQLTRETYTPGAMTPLYDATAKIIFDTEKVAKKKDAVVVVIHTDGYENYSQEYTLEKIKKLIEKKTKDGWDFVFLGADISKEQAVSMGIPKGSAVSYAKVETRSTMKTFSDAMSNYSARGGSVGASGGFFDGTALEQSEEDEK